MNATGRWFQPPAGELTSARRTSIQTQATDSGSGARGRSSSPDGMGWAFSQPDAGSGRRRQSSFRWRRISVTSIPAPSKPAPPPSPASSRLPLRRISIRPQRPAASPAAWKTTIRWSRSPGAIPGGRPNLLTHWQSVPADFRGASQAAWSRMTWRSWCVGDFT